MDHLPLPKKEVDGCVDAMQLVEIGSYLHILVISKHANILGLPNHGQQEVDTTMITCTCRSILVNMVNVTMFNNMGLHNHDQGGHNNDYLIRCTCRPRM